MTIFRILPLLLALTVAGCAPTPTTLPAPAARTLTIASWNLEFLAERDGTGCQPRQAADYDAMRAIANGLGADVIAFEEAENAAAAARVFDPKRYTIVMEARAGQPGGTCGGKAGNQPFIRQAVGFAIRKGLAFDRAPDVTALQNGNPNLRSGVDITIRPASGTPLRLLAVHLKSGCFDGTTGPACPTLLAQILTLERWIDDAARGPTRFAILGDWNRRLARAGDQVWAELDDGDPPNADLTLADQDVAPACDPRYREFIDHIVLDRRAAVGAGGFAETHYAGEHFSDHCPISVRIAR